MRVAGGGAAAAVAGLIAGLVVSLGAAAWLRSTTPEAALVWRAAPTGKLALWTLAGAHGAPLRLEAGARVSDELGELGERIGELFGGDESELRLPSPQGVLEVRIASLTVLAALGLAIAVLMSRSGAARLEEVATGAAAAALVNGVGLAALAAAGATSLGFDARIVRVGLEAGVPVGISAVLGAIWGGLFAFVGGLAAPRVAEALAPPWRATSAAVRRAALVAGAASVGVLIVMAIEQSGRSAGVGVSADLGAIGVVLLGLNVVAAAIVMAHGASMSVALDAGPLSGFTRIGYVPAGSSSLPASRWLFVVVVIAAGIAAGRVLKRRLGDRSDANAAITFGVVWGFALALLAFLLRVRVLSSFSVGSLAAGGGASINLFVAFVFGSVVGGVTSYIGMLTARAGPEHGMTPALEAITATAAEEDERTCPQCGHAVPAADRFCGTCGSEL